MLCIAFGSQPWAIAGIFSYQVITGAASAGVFAIPQILAGPGASARWVGVQNCCGNFAGVIATWLTGQLVGQTHHFTAAFVTAAVVSLSGLIGWVWMVPRVAPLRWASLAANADQPALAQARQ